MGKSPAYTLKRSSGQGWSSAKADKVNRCRCEADNRRERSILPETFIREYPGQPFFRLHKPLKGLKNTNSLAIRPTIM